MQRQPIRKIGSGGGFPNAPLPPEMAAQAYRVIQIWAMIEYTYGAMLKTLISADPAAANAMYLAVTSADVRERMLFAAADEVLTPEKASLVRATVGASIQSKEERNALLITSGVSPMNCPMPSCSLHQAT